MDFKKWLIEWEGNRFSQEDDLINSPYYPNSKYKGKGLSVKSTNFNKPARMYGFGPDEELLKHQMKKKMEK
jgi:hypothetical protein